MDDSHINAPQRARIERCERQNTPTPNSSIAAIISKARTERCPTTGSTVRSNFACPKIAPHLARPHRIKNHPDIVRNAICALLPVLLIHSELYLLRFTKFFFNQINKGTQTPSNRPANIMNCFVERWFETSGPKVAASYIGIPFAFVSIICNSSWVGKRNPTRYERVLENLWSETLVPEVKNV